MKKLHGNRKIDAVEPGGCIRWGQGYEALWKAVVRQAFWDMFDSNRVDERRHAYRWILENGHDFRLVCDLAGLDSGYVRGKLIERLKKGKPSKWANAEFLHACNLAGISWRESER